jgi:hypothetical protein
LEVERHKLGPNLTPVTKETFAVWKKTRMDKKEAEKEVLKKAKDAQHAAGKASGMSGRDLVRIALLFCVWRVNVCFSVPIQSRVVR